MCFSVGSVCVLLNVSQAQTTFRADFDADSTLSPQVWRGTDTAWVISNKQLQSHWNEAKSYFYLGTAKPLQADSWEWWMKLAFNPSSQNYVDVYLLADTANLLSPVVNGYFVRVGNTTDEISLYHITAGKPPVKLIDGIDGVLDKSTNTLKVKVTRHAGKWQMQTAIGAAGYGVVAAAPDSSAGMGGYFGFAVRQSTASFFDKHYFDDIALGAFVDTGVTTPPDTVVTTPPDTVVTNPPTTPPDTVVTNPPTTPPDTVVTNPPTTPPDTVVTNPPTTPPDTVVTNPPTTPLDTVVTNPPTTPPDTVVTNPPTTPPDTVVTNPPTTPPDTVVTNPPTTPPDTVVTNPPTIPPDTVVTNPPTTPPDTVVTNPPTTPPDTVVTNPPTTPPDTVVTNPPVISKRGPELYEVVINEFLADPTPAKGLPAYRFVELQNRSGDTLQLEGCTLGNRIRKSIFSKYVLAPDSFLVVCDESAAPAYRAFGATLGLKAFPAFKTADTIVLRNASGKLIHAVAYDKSTYKNDDLAKGGHSLEMIAGDMPCGGMQNWAGSTAPAGGTPGHRNTIAGTIQAALPDLENVFPIDSIHLQAQFSGTLDSGMAAGLEHYQFKDGALKADSVHVAGPLWDQVMLTLHQPAQPGTLYTLVTKGLTDCKGGESGLKNEGVFALTVPTDSLDVVFNEVMYDPLPDMPQFIEIYNRSAKAVDLSQLDLVLRDKNGKDKNIGFLSTKPRLLLASGYAVISNDPDILCRSSACGTESPLLTMALPQLSNEGAELRLMDRERGLDAFAYSPEMQFGLLGSAKGISLERIDVNAATQASENWHSAAASAGYSTPGHKNSQSGGDGLTDGWTISPSVFSPDHDGIDDLAFIDYRVAHSGFMANITVFDASGRVVRGLVHNSLLGTLGRFAWDGRGDQLQPLPAGIYIIYAAIFDQQGTVQHWKQPLVLARRLK